jgi:hypothetical protein
MGQQSKWRHNARKQSSWQQIGCHLALSSGLPSGYNLVCNIIWVVISIVICRSHLALSYGIVRWIVIWHSQVNFHLALSRELASGIAGELSSGIVRWIVIWHCQVNCHLVVHLGWPLGFQLGFHLCSHLSFRLSIIWRFHLRCHLGLSSVIVILNDALSILFIYLKLSIEEQAQLKNAGSLQY